MDTEWELVGRMIVAALAGGLIGLDRQVLNKPAGIRTHMLVVTGVGFLGAGAILRSGERVSGLTTAAGIWVTAAVGVLIGAGFWVIGIAATVILLFIVNLTAFASSRIGIGDQQHARENDS
jgi:putative Mg2+ transporter-C (MgtC) family protein